MDPTPLIRSTSSLNRISRSLTGFSSGITRASFLARNIAKNLNTDTRFKKNVIEDEKSFFRKRRENKLRKKREEQIEAQGIGGAVKRQGRILADSTKGFFTRILDFLGLTLIGWIVSNVPNIIKSITGVVKKIKEISSNLKNHIQNITTFLGGMGEKLTELRDSIDIFNFADSIENSKKSFVEINNKIEVMNNDFVNSVNRFSDTSDLEKIADKFDPKIPDQFLEDDPDETGDEIISTMNKGGIVPGEGNEDTVPAMLTPGEFVITKEATEKIGTDILASMNADKGEFTPNLPPSRIDYPRTVTGFREFARDLRQWGKDNPYGTKFGKRVEKPSGSTVPESDNIEGVLSEIKNLKIPSSKILTKDLIEVSEKLKSKESEMVKGYSSMINSITGIMESENGTQIMNTLKQVGDTIKPQLKDASNQINDVIETDEFQNTIKIIKTKMKGVVKEITPERRGQIISVPISAEPQTSVVPMNTGSRKGVTSKRLNTNEYYKHLTTLITAYT
tara:strand:- start:1971 stop:3488 length:1518 start_codon:yes stop_codon:yes gene_type:complete